jgi:hypothetical protein
MSQSTAVRKKLMIAAMIKHHGIITAACGECGVNRETHWKWTKNDPKYLEAIEKIGEMKKDYIEKKFFELVDLKNDKAIIFAMKSLLKDRGYQQTIDLGLNGKGSITFNFGDEEESSE